MNSHCRETGTARQTGKSVVYNSPLISVRPLFAISPATKPDAKAAQNVAARRKLRPIGMRLRNPDRYYNPKFYRELESAQDSAREILPIIFRVMRPASVIDIGCGTGHWPSTARELGIKDILGVDGPWVTSQLVIPREDFLEHDL